MNREQALKQIWREMPRDYRGIMNGTRTVMIWRNGTTLVPLDSLTDAEIGRYVKGFENG